MNADTKKHIDSARQILVGVVPNPTSQIDQITNALIYKFMDDMDQAAIKAGGKPAFFIGDLEKYAWTRLIDSKIGNQEKMNLYVEGFIKLSESKKIPELFRGILKSAYLPYRSPEVLDLFLKEINYFDYSHPEELGNAYEYLLSIMSSQGDAGQFRTPRHIIDFIVGVVNPTKDDKVLDPACGTAGFLISAYRHILSQHDRKNLNGANDKEKSLTPDQRRNLMNNFEGYDIDPGMVRIAQVNMYLHQFKNPKIFQYDSLSSDERWGDKFDVILANPPFMSPQGGIRPHSKFSIQSSRSEVLFVDYIMSHLRPRGRAGIIVPEGVVFKNDLAYKQLRKNLVEDGLYAVVSLPSGVFNPYSGVKTNILFFDNEISKLTDGVIFIKIKNDGFDLGAQRREIEKNDLPIVASILIDYRNTIVKGKGSLGSIKEFIKNFDFSTSNVSIVSKKKISENDDYNLLGDHYKSSGNSIGTKWPIVKLEDVLDYEQPNDYIVESVDYNDDYKIPVLTAGKTFILGHTNEKKGIFQDKLPVIIFDDFTTATKFVDFPFKVKSSAMKILHAKKDRADIKYIFYVMQNIMFSNNEHKRYWISEYSKINIPLPPLDIQKQIVKELDVYQKIISGAKQVVENWTPVFVIDNEWKNLSLGEVCDIYTGNSAPQDKSLFKNGKYPFFRTSDVGAIHLSDNLIKTRDKLNDKGIVGLKLFRKGSILFPKSGASTFLNHRVIMGVDGYVSSHLAVIVPKQKYTLNEFVYFFLNMVDAKELTSDQSYPSLKKSDIAKILIPIPPIEIQKEIVDSIKSQSLIVDFNKKMIDIYEQKIKEVIVNLWKK